MPRVAFTPENKKSTTNYDYPKLKLKRGEQARIVVGLENPEVEYVHTLRKPKMENGQPVMTSEERRGRQVETNAMDFVARTICIGDQGILDDKGSDPKNCPMCEMAKDHPDWMQAPQARYAVHVIRYRTKSGSFEIATPFAVEVLVWSFTARMFNKLVEFATEHGDLRQRDLLLGPCENENFQKFDIAVGSKAEWVQSDDRQQLTALTWKENRIEDLSIAAGTRKEKRYIDMDLEDVTNAWNDLSGASTQSSGSLSAGLDDLMGSTVSVEKKTEAQGDWSPSADLGNEGIQDILGGISTPSTTAPAAPSTSIPDMDDLLGTASAVTTPPAPAVQESAPVAPEVTPVETPAPAAPAAPAPEAGGALNFDDILGNLSK